MKILILGAGAIGTYLAAKLAKSGIGIGLLSRKNFQILNEKGIKIKEGKKEFTITNFKLYSSINEIPKSCWDFIFFTVKAYDLLKILNETKDLFKEIPALFFQNGLGIEERVENYWGENFYSAALTTAVNFKDGNFIEANNLKGGISLAPVKRKEALQELFSLFKKARFNVSLVDNYKSLRWSKLLLNVLGNATCAILDWDIVEVFSNPNLFKLEIQAFREIVKIMKMLKIKAVNLPGFPVILIIKLFSYLPYFLLKPLVKYKIAKSRGGKLPSLHQDLILQREKTEVIYLNGAVLKEAEKLKINLPANKLLTETLKGIASGKINWLEFKAKPEKLIKKLAG
ncbi:MAG: ketopantoate reductase family protein [Armatimonadetes bacterium]|nr:ketopantoate reductase family protein [Armatimonadota bacterium]